MNKRVLVTGGTGFIGRWAVQSLAAKAHEVHVCARHPQHLSAPGVHLHEVDLFCGTAAVRLVQHIEPTHILHLAWEATPGKYWTSDRNLIWVSATLELVRAAALVGCKRFVAAGSCAEYDWTDGGVVNELRSPVAPVTLYGAAKLATFQLLQAYTQHSPMSFAWARIFYQYGPHEHPHRVIPTVVRSLLAQTPAECTHGEQLRDFLYSVDTGDALAAVLESEIVGAINIGSGRPIHLKELILRVAEIAGSTSLVRFGARPTPQGEPLILVPTITRLRDEVGWAPRHSLTESLEQTVDFWRRTIQQNTKSASS